ncbi:MAG: nucleotidyltransferase domain-containing protein [Clostridiales bacterium]|nr:nucleotidyltransferase domain-containing protein [Clostridiales bacterium]
MCSRNTLNSILKEIDKAYQNVYGKALKKVILYGSYARGDYNDTSDIDIAAIVDGDRAVLQKKLDAVWDISSDLELKYEVIISPTVIPSDDFERFKAAMPYYRNINYEGVVISERGREEDIIRLSS